MDSADYRTEALSFTSEGTTCSATLYRPEHTESDVPCVVLAVGITQTQADGFPQFAQRFAEAGFAALTFDYRYLGHSDGQPRQLIDYQQQRADLRAAVEFSRTLEGVDPERIVLWGFSFGGGHTIEVASQDDDLAAAIVLAPFLDGLKSIIAYGVRNNLQVLAATARATWIREPVRMPVIGARRQLAVFDQPEAAIGFESVRGQDSHWQNHLLFNPTRHLVRTRPIRQAPNVRCPLWVGLCTRDTMVPPMPIRRLAQRAPQGELHLYQGGHFEGFLDHFDDVVDAQLEFLHRCLGTA